MRWLGALLLAAGAPAAACVPPTYDVLFRFTDVIVDGKFYVVDEAAGKGFILAERVKKGRRKQRYEVTWNPKIEEELQAHELDCIVAIPESGLFQTFWLSRRKDRSFEIIGRFGHVREGK